MMSHQKKLGSNNKPQSSAPKLNVSSTKSASGGKGNKGVNYTKKGAGKSIKKPIKATSKTVRKVADKWSNLTSSPLSDLPPSSDSVGAARSSGQVAHSEAERIPTSGLSRYKSGQHKKINESLRNQKTIERGVKNDIEGIDRAIADYMQSHHAPITQMLYRGTSCLEFGYHTESDL